MPLSATAEEIEVTPELQEQYDNTAAYLAERMAEDNQEDVTSRVGRINNGIDKPDDAPKGGPAAQAKTETAKAQPDTETEKTEPAKTEPAKTETEKTDKTAKADTEQPEKTETTDKDKDKTETEQQPTRSAKNRARREEALRRSIEAEAEGRWKNTVDGLQAQIDELKAAKAQPDTETEKTEPAKTEPAKTEQPDKTAKTERPEMPKIGDYGDNMDQFYADMDAYDEALEAWKAGNNGQQPDKTAAAPATQPDKPKAATQPAKTEQEPLKSPLATTEERTLTPVEEYAKTLTEVLEDHEADEVLEDLVGLAESGQVLLSEGLLQQLTGLESEEEIVKIATAIRDKPRLSQKLSRLAKSARAKEFKKLIAPSQEKEETTETAAISPLRSSPGSNRQQVDMDKVDTAEYLRIRQEEEAREFQNRGW